MEYNQKIMDTFINLNNAGELKDYTITGKVQNKAFGDTIKLYLNINKDTETILDASFKSCGCVATIACSSAICDLLKNKTINQALKLTSEDITKVFGSVPSLRGYASVLAIDTFNDAIKEYRKLQAKQVKQAKPKK